MKFSERRALVAAMRSDTAHEHFVQFYEDDAVLLASVSAFIGGSIAAGGGGFVVATEAHRLALEDLLAVQGIDLESARRDGRYAAFDAEQCLDALLVERWPDRQRFLAQWEPLIADAAKRFSNVAIFAEMVALLWRDGSTARPFTWSASGTN